MWNAIKSNLYNNYTKLHGTHVLQIIFAVSSEFVVWERRSKMRFPRTTVRKRISKAQKSDFAYTLIPHSWQPSHPALYCWPFAASPSPFLTCSPPGPTFLCLKPHSCLPFTWRCSVSPRLASPFCTHCSLQSCFSTLHLTLNPSPLAKMDFFVSCQKINFDKVINTKLHGHILSILKAIWYC